ncbi:MAG: DUF1761 domain-containing protein [Cyclobacteriaceae bacterium]
MPEIEINYLAVLIAVVATFFFGFIWYTPLFGKAWAHEMGYDPDMKPDGGQMAKGMIMMVAGNFFMAWVFAHNLAVWNPETWGQGPIEGSLFTFALSASFFTWLGFFFPVDLGSMAWEKKSFKLFMINTSYHFLALLIAACIIAYM